MDVFETNMLEMMISGTTGKEKDPFVARQKQLKEEMAKTKTASPTWTCTMCGTGTPSKQVVCVGCGAPKMASASRFDGTGFKRIGLRIELNDGSGRWLCEWCEKVFKKDEKCPKCCD